jgi:hypothetical protein
MYRDVFSFDAAGERERLFDHLAAAHDGGVMDIEQALATLIYRPHLQELYCGEDRRTNPALVTASRFSVAPLYSAEHVRVRVSGRDAQEL